MVPVLFEAPYGFKVRTGDAPALRPVATITEEEGLTVAARLAEMQAAGMVSAPWARISANVIAGFHHDHIFVQTDRRPTALAARREVSRA